MDPRPTGGGDGRSLEWRGKLNYSFAERNERTSFKAHPNQVHVEEDFDKLPQPSTPLYAPTSGGSAGVFNAYGSKQVKLGGSMLLGSRASPYPTAAGSLAGMKPSLLQYEQMQASASSGPVSSLSTAQNPLAGPTARMNPLAPQAPPAKISSHDWIRGLKSSNMTVFPTSVLAQMQGGESSSSSLPAQMSVTSAPAFPDKPQESDPSKERAEKALGNFFAAAETAEKPPVDPLVDWSARCQKTLQQHDEGHVTTEFPLLGRALASAAPSKPQKARRSSNVVSSILLGVPPSVVEGFQGKGEKRPRPEDAEYSSAPDEPPQEIPEKSCS